MIILVVIIAFILLCDFAQASTIAVDHGGSIQAAINIAKPGDVIEVQSGIYSGPITLTKRLTLRGVDTGEGRPVIDGRGQGTAVTILLEGSTLEGFEVRNSGKSELEAGIKAGSRNITIRNNLVRANHQGIRLQISSGSVLEGNEVEENQRGIIIFQSYGNKIRENNLSGNVYGIMVWNSQGNTIANNKIRTSQLSGIYIVNSQDNYVTGNNASDNSLGLSIATSPANIITNNIFYNNSDHGIYIKSSGGNVLKNNRMDENLYDFYVEGMDYSHFNNDVDASNIISGRPIYYLVDISNAVVDSSSRAGVVYCIRCRNITIKDLTANKNDIGIFLYRTANSLLENNTIGNDKSYGIELLESNHNTLKRNNASRSQAGIYLDNSSRNILKGNNAFDNIAGIVMVKNSGNNTLYLNNLVYNSNYGGYDEGINRWDYGNMGNFYYDFNCTDYGRDGICDFEHTIPGGNSVDRYPLAAPVSFEVQRRI